MYSSPCVHIQGYFGCTCTYHERNGINVNLSCSTPKCKGSSVPQQLGVTATGRKTPRRHYRTVYCLQVKLYTKKCIKELNGCPKARIMLAGLKYLTRVLLSSTQNIPHLSDKLPSFPVFPSRLRGRRMRVIAQAKTNEKPKDLTAPNGKT